MEELYNMYFPIQLRLTLFYAFLLVIALWIFGTIVYTQAQQRAYNELDNALRSRAASVRLGKDLLGNQNSSNLPFSLPGVDGLGTGNVSIEVLDNQLHLLATTSSKQANIAQTGVSGLVNSPAPWDIQAARHILQHPLSSNGDANGIYSTIAYQGQRIRIYTLMNNDFGGEHIIQTARSEQDIEQSLTDLQLLLLRGGALVILFAFIGGWFITWSVLSRVQHITKSAQSISASRDFSQRVPDKSRFGRDELTSLAYTFNEMLANLEKAYQRQQRFVADASHELRAPITSIRCNLDLLAQAPDLPPEEAQAALADARAEADRMGRLVNDLLTLAHSDETVQEIKTKGYKKSEFKEPVIDLDSLLLRVYRQYKQTVERENGNKIQQGPRLMLQNITPVKVFGDADQLHQVLVALIDNALKYTPYDGSVTLSLSIDKNDAVLTVSDTGIGILPEDLPYIFERFYRADRARSRDRGGTGLGLTIVQNIVQEHAGTIEVESTQGQGSTFILKLPTVRDLN
jgi:two-component system, OmpR family, sensor kinase